MASGYNGGMPPESKIPFDPTDVSSEALAKEGHLLPAGHKSSPVGPTVGVVIILVLLILGALYFWGANLNRPNPNDNLPLIPSNDSTENL